jgi:hypothetical protein
MLVEMESGALQDVIVEMTNDDGVGGVDYSFECIGNVSVRPCCRPLTTGGMQNIHVSCIQTMLRERYGSVSGFYAA